VRFLPIDVQFSDWDCTVQPDGSVRLGLRYVSGLRAEVGKAIAARKVRLKPDSTTDASSRRVRLEPDDVSRSVRLQPDDVNHSVRLQPDDVVCPKCGCDDPSMLERVEGRGTRPGTYFCNSCSHDWQGCLAEADARNRVADIGSGSVDPDLNRPA